MSSTLSTSSLPPLVWNENTVLEKGIVFLRQKKEGLQVFQDLRNTAQSHGYYSASSKKAIKKVKEVAVSFRREIEPLEMAATKLLTIESAKNPLSDKTKRLSEIISVARFSLEYFTSVVDNTYCPTLLEQRLKDMLLISNKITPWMAGISLVLTGVAIPISVRLSNDMFSLAGTSLAVYISSNAIRYLNQKYIDNPREQQINTTKTLFEKAIGSERVAA